MLDKKYYKALSLFFVILFILNVIVSRRQGNIANILWFCSFNTILFAIALYRQDNFLVSTVVTASFFLQTLWVIDITSYFIYGRLAIGTAGYIIGAPLSRLFLTFYHFLLLVVPILIAFDMKKFHKKSWIGASVFLLFTFVVTLLLTSQNINCVRSNCVADVFIFLKTPVEYLTSLFPALIVHWLVLTILVFIPTNIFFNYVVKWINK